eukprot:m51a1_g6822 hypothetical protein (296) ;mRNA; f:14950-15837
MSRRLQDDMVMSFLAKSEWSSAPVDVPAGCTHALRLTRASGPDEIACTVRPDDLGRAEGFIVLQTSSALAHSHLRALYAVADDGAAALVEHCSSVDALCRGVELATTTSPGAAPATARTRLEARAAPGGTAPMAWLELTWSAEGPGASDGARVSAAGVREDCRGRALAGALVDAALRTWVATWTVEEPGAGTRALRCDGSARSAVVDAAPAPSGAPVTLERLLLAEGFAPGELVKRFSAGAGEVVEGAGAAYACAWCLAPSAPLRCSRCRGSVYCSAACQRAHWPLHKRLCNTTA